MEKRESFFPNNPEASKGNGWADASDNRINNGWGGFSSNADSELISNGWMDKPQNEEYNGWGATYTAATNLKASSNGWMAEPRKEEYSGWSSSDLTETPRTICNGWMDETLKKDYGGWDVPESRPITSTSVQRTEIMGIMTPNLATEPNEFHPSVLPAPSAPPVPMEDYDEDPICAKYPYIDARPVDFPTACLENKDRKLNEAKDSGSEPSSSCVICWEAPAEGACVPCGHMVGCMPCLSDIKSKKGDCPVCRAKIDFLEH